MHFIYKFTLYFFLISALNNCATTKPAPLPVQEADPVNVAIMLPLRSEGNNALISEYHEMIKLGLSDGAKTKIKVITYDISNEDALKKSIEKIINSKTQIILGPLHSPHTQQAFSHIKGKDIILISLSNNPTLADDNVLVFGHAPARQLDKIIKYLMESGYKNFITLFPSGHYSQTIVKIVQDTIAQADSVLVSSEFYDNSEDGMAHAVRIVSDVVDNLNEQDTNLSQPVVLVADEPTNIEKLLGYINEYNLDKKAVIAGDSRTIVMPNDVNILFTGSHDIITTKIDDKARDKGIEKVNFMHLLSYDLGNMVSEKIGGHWNYKQFVQNLSANEYWPGISGNVKFIDSIAIRDYHIIKKESGKFVPVPSAK
jgi:ABC-type branched-subunit amino acid transport system substrate-binding protein